MQDQANALPQWLLSVLQNLAMFSAGGLIVRLITLWLNRRKPFVEVKKTEAETTEITIRSHATAGDSLTRMMDRLEKAVANNEALRTQLYNAEETRIDLEEKCGKLEILAESYERQMYRMAGTLKTHGLNYDDTQDKPVHLLANDED